MSLLEIAKRVEEEIKARKVARVTVADVLRIFPGARIYSSDQQTLPCVHCGGRMTERLERRRHILACGRCGRRKK